MSKMKIAIIHDYLDVIGGGEKLVLELARGLDADIYTTDLNMKNLRRLDVKGVKIKSLGKNIKFPILKQIHASWHFSNAKISGYDLYILSGNWTVFAARKHQPNMVYFHTPVRMFYDSKKKFYDMAPWYAKLPFLLWVKIHSHLLETQLKHCGKMISNSRNTQARVKKYHHKDSIIIYPPIKNYPCRKYGDFYLSVNRIYPHKRIDLQIDAFRELKSEKLVIVGGYLKGDHAESYARKVLKGLPENVTYLGEVDEKTLERLYSGCKGFITTALDEDFGMTVVEAMSAGKAVIATNEGGYKETVIDGKTGYLITAEKSKLVDAIKKISKEPSRFKDACIKNSAKYSEERFIKQMRLAAGWGKY